MSTSGSTVSACRGYRTRTEEGAVRPWAVEAVWRCGVVVEPGLPRGALTEGARAHAVAVAARRARRCSARRERPAAAVRRSTRTRRARIATWRTVRSRAAARIPTTAISRIPTDSHSEFKRDGGQSHLRRFPVGPRQTADLRDVASGRKSRAPGPLLVAGFRALPAGAVVCLIIDRRRGLRWSLPSDWAQVRSAIQAFAYTRMGRNPHRAGCGVASGRLSTACNDR